MDFLQLAPLQESGAFRAIVQRITGAEAPLPVTCVGPRCNHPWYFPIWSMVGSGWWLEPAELPQLPSDVPPPSLELLSSTWRGGTRTLRLTLRGPSQMALVLPGTVARWSFATKVPPPRTDCSCHFVFLASGTAAPSWTFELDFRNQSASDPIHLRYHGHYLESSTPLLVEAEASLPSWFTPVSFVSAVGSMHYVPPEETQG
mmetsp:Transcript_9011/g.15755  ORF Transcript_9011/g.15755 Transcript_9011/m.15755 type:complete len:202 (-) Transcript_9011:106-711(-)